MAFYTPQRQRERSFEFSFSAILEFSLTFQLGHSMVLLRTLSLRG